MSRWQASADRVQLVDQSGVTRGQANEFDAHRSPGLLHRGFSVFLIDCSRRLLIQRRSVLQGHSAGYWSNTCTGHPRPGETPFQAAWRRLDEEWAAEPFAMNQVGTISYGLKVPGLGEDDWLTERERNHVFVGMTLNTPTPGPYIAEQRFVPMDDVDLIMETWEFTAWFRAAWSLAHPYLSMLVRRPDGGTRSHSRPRDPGKGPNRADRKDR